MIVEEMITSFILRLHIRDSHIETPMPEGYLLLITIKSISNECKPVVV